MNEQRLLDLVDRLDGMLHDAPRAGVRGGIRLDREAAYEIVDEMRAALAPFSAPAPEGEGVPRRELQPIVDELNDFARSGKAVPLTGQVRLDREHLYWLLGRLHAAVDPTDTSRL